MLTSMLNVASSLICSMLKFRHSSILMLGVLAASVATSMLITYPLLTAKAASSVVSLSVVRVVPLTEEEKVDYRIVNDNLVDRFPEVKAALGEADKKWDEYVAYCADEPILCKYTSKFPDPAFSTEISIPGARASLDGVGFRDLPGPPGFQGPTIFHGLQIQNDSKFYLVSIVGIE
jgi:hypothetical protein